MKEGREGGKLTSVIIVAPSSNDAAANASVICSLSRSLKCDSMLTCRSG
jgi:hypothetical protein